MKTLDEVIKAMETDPVPMAYTARLSVHEDIMTDALHYMKEYQKILPLVPSLINTAIAVQKKGKTIG